MARKTKAKKVKTKPLTKPRRRRTAGIGAPTERKMVKAKIQEEVTRQAGLNFPVLSFWSPEDSPIPMLDNTGP